jgi:hypothetical protein
VWCGGEAYEVEIVDYHQEIEVAKRINPIHPGDVLKEDFMAKNARHATRG